MKYLLSSFIFFSSMAWALTPPDNLISKEKAKLIASSARSGTLQSQELEHDNGRWVYSIDIVSKDRSVHEVIIDAETGKIISQIAEDHTN